MKYIQRITYKDKAFLFVNLVRLTDAEFIEALKEYRLEWLAKPDFPILLDLTGTALTSDAVQLAREINWEHHKFSENNLLPVYPVAIVGISAIAHTVANLIAHTDKTYFAPDLESAKEWLYKNC